MDHCEFRVSLVFYKIASAKTVSRHIVKPPVSETKQPKTKKQSGQVWLHTVNPGTLVAEASLIHAVSSRPAGLQNETLFKKL